MSKKLNVRQRQMLDLFALALQLKAVGHHLFIYYYPHVNQCSIKLHINGWALGEKEKADIEYDFHLETCKADTYITHLQNTLTSFLKHSNNLTIETFKQFQELENQPQET